MDWQLECERLKTENERLELVNAELKAQLGIAAHEVATVPSIHAKVHMHSASEEKVTLFRSLFHGRDDVYAKRWYSEKLQKSGYAPVCENEWQDGLCDKKAFKCAKCPNRKLAALSDKAIYAHLSGKDALGRDVIGLYPMLTDETCYFLAIDFDEENWRADVTAVRMVCSEQGIAAAVERSRSGNGAHLWIFFSESVSCTMARKLGSGLLTLAMERNHLVRFDSYDRLFPNQDIMPSGGFGNLIALPLQGQARKAGNSLFVDEGFAPYDDPWAFLSELPRLGQGFVDKKTKELCRCGELGPLVQEDQAEKPWERGVSPPELTAFDFAKPVELVRANMVYVYKNGVSEKALGRIKRLAAFKNPGFYKAQAMRLPTYGKPRVICAAEETADYLAIPRGCETELVSLLEDAGARYQWEDKTNPGRPIQVEFAGELREEQRPAADALRAVNNGVLSATTAFGKTVIAASLIAEKKVNTLILVHTQALLNQWKIALEQFLVINETLPDLPQKRGRKKVRSIIGQLGGAKKQLSGIVDIAIIQSVANGGEALPLAKEYGMVIVDECHHVSAVSFEAVLKQVNARYVYGMTATPARQDGHQPIIHMQCGPIRYRVDAREQAGKREFTHSVLPRFTRFAKPISAEEKGWQITDIYAALCENQPRNELIIRDVTEALCDGRTPIILTERFAHAQNMAQMLEGKCGHVVLLSGKGTAKEKRERMESLREISDAESLAVVATGKYVGEGFDLPRLDTLFLAMPIAWKGTLAQYAGRLHRDYAGKKEVAIYDYVDVRIPVLERMYHKRLSAYAALGYKAKVSAHETPEKIGIIFDEKNFLGAFAQDISNVKKEIAIVSPFLNKGRIAQMLKLLQEPLIRGVKAVVVTRPASDDNAGAGEKTAELIGMLEDGGAKIICKEKIYHKFALMDERVVWYGSVNLLSFGRSGESMMRFENAEIATELLDDIQKE